MGLAPLESPPNHVVFSVASESDFPDDRSLRATKISFVVSVSCVDVGGLANSSVARRELSEPASLFRLAMIDNISLQTPTTDAAVSAMLRDTPMPFPLPPYRILWAPQDKRHPGFTQQGIVQMLKLFIAQVVDKNDKSDEPRKLLRVIINITSYNENHNLISTSHSRKQLALRNSLFYRDINLAARKLIGNPPRQVSLKLFLFVVFFLCGAIVMAAIRHFI